MTEAEWMASNNPTPMLAWLENLATDRKLRLALVAAIRESSEQIHRPDRNHFIDLNEQYADGTISVDVLRATEPQWYAPWTGISTAGWYDASPESYALRSLAIRSQRMPRLHNTAYWHSLARIATAPLVVAFREIFGNPFRPVVFDPNWLTSDVVAMARGMYETRDFAAMPILADALQDAGCENVDVLEHCRGAEPHVRGCWVVDLILGKE